MHQPIQWHEWGDEAFAAAKRENKPMLLDIGAVWCHWCHVMDRESYDDPEVAKIVNEHFIAVKVDRDERPDIDIRYQVAVSALTGQGGWPLTAFLTPDGKPFYGGTYFPPDDRYSRPSFKRVLLSIANAYREKNGDVMEQAQMVESAVSRAESFAGGREADDISPSIVEAVVASAVKMFDPANGGFGHAPKFPHSSALDLVMSQFARSGDEELRTVFVTTLEKMAWGGVYDQLAGGFHRYSVDEHWGVPHFEKMSYDNSELLKNYVHAYQATGNGFLADVARDIIRWMDEWLSDRDRGGFYASQDADYSMDDDGDYFTWTLDETRAALTEDEASVACLHYDISEIGQMHHNSAKNVLHVRAGVDEISKRLGFAEARVRDLLASAKTKMYIARKQRPTPYVDKTVYTGWNAMCISAYLEAAKVLGLEPVRSFALLSLDRLLAEGLTDGGALIRTALRHVIAYSDPAAARLETKGMLDDYAFTVIACLDAYECTADLRYFNSARAIADAMIAGFYDEQNGGFFDTRRESSRSGNPMADSAPNGILDTPRKPFQDSPTPAGNSVAGIALLRLQAYTNEASYRERAQRTLELYAGAAPQHGMFAATYGLAVEYFLRPHTQIVIVGKDISADEMRRAASRRLSLNTAIIRLDADLVVAPNLPPALAETIPLLPALREGRSFAVVCSGFACQPPVFSVEALLKILEAQQRAA